MSPLLLLKLPLLVQKAIVYQWDLITIFSFSILSERTKNHLKECNLKVDKFSLLIYEAAFADRSSIKLESLENSLDIAIWDGSYLRVGNFVTNEKFKPISIWGLNCERLESIESMIEVFEKSIQHLLHFLKVRKIELQFGGDVNLINFFFWKCTPKFDSITIDTYSSEPVYLTPDELKFLLEDVTTHYLQLNVAVIKRSDFKYPTSTTHQKLLKIQKIKIRNDIHDWIDFNKFVLLDFVSIHFSFSSATVKELNSILKSWLSGTNETLEEFKLYAYKYSELQRDPIFAGIKATSTVFTDEELGNRYWSVRGAIKMDIKREHDGRQATVILYGKHFAMLVWNEKQLKKIGRL